MSKAKLIIPAIILALALTVGKLATEWNTSAIDTTYQVELTRPAPINWAKVTPTYELINQNQLSATERSILQERK